MRTITSKRSWKVDALQTADQDEAYEANDEDAVPEASD